MTISNRIIISSCSCHLTWPTASLSFEFVGNLSTFVTSDGIEYLKKRIYKYSITSDKIVKIENMKPCLKTFNSEPLSAVEFSGQLIKRNVSLSSLWMTHDNGAKELGN